MLFPYGVRSRSSGGFANGSSPAAIALAFRSPHAFVTNVMPLSTDVIDACGYLFHA